MTTIADDSIMITADINFVDSTDLTPLHTGSPQKHVYLVSNKPYPGYHPIIKAVQPFSVSAKGSGGVQIGAGSITIHNPLGEFDFLITDRHSKTGIPRYVFNKQEIIITRWKNGVANSKIRALISEINFVGQGDIVFVFTDFMKELDTPLYVINKKGWSDPTNTYHQIWNPKDRYKPYNYNQFYKEVNQIFIEGSEFATLKAWIISLKRLEVLPPESGSPPVSVGFMADVFKVDGVIDDNLVKYQLYNHFMPRETGSSGGMVLAQPKGGPHQFYKTLDFSTGRTMHGYDNQFNSPTGFDHTKESDIFYLPGELTWTNERKGIPNEYFAMYAERENAIPFCIGDVFNVPLMSIKYSIHPDLAKTIGIDLSNCYVASPSFLLQSDVKLGTSIEVLNVRDNGIQYVKGPDAGLSTAWAGDAEWRVIGGISWIIEMRNAPVGTVTADLRAYNISPGTAPEYDLTDQPTHGFTTATSLVSILTELLNRKREGVELFGSLDRNIIFKGVKDDRLALNDVVDTSLFKLGYFGQSSDNLLQVCNQLAASANMTLYSPIHQYTTTTPPAPEVCLTYNQVPPAFAPLVGNADYPSPASYPLISYHNIVKDSFQITESKMPRVASVYIGICRNWTPGLTLAGRAEDDYNWKETLSKEYLEIYKVNDSKEIATYKFSPVSNRSIEGTLLINEDEGDTIAQIRLKLELVKTITFRVTIPNIVDDTLSTGLSLAKLTSLGRLVRLRHHRFLPIRDPLVDNWGVVIGISKDITKDHTTLEILI